MVKAILTREELAALHFKLVEALKAILFLGHASFLKAGYFLSEIKSKKTYKTEDQSEDITWEGFCEREDIPIPAKTPEGRRRVADALIRVYDIFIKKYSYQEQYLAEIGWTKLDMIATKALKGKSISDEWVEKARTLTARDLQAELRSNGMSLKDIQECQHENVYEMRLFKCPDCGQVTKDDPRI